MIRRRCHKPAVALLALFLSACGAEIIRYPTPEPARPDDPSLTGTTQTLIRLLEQQDRTQIDPEDYESTSLHELIRLGTPAGYRIKLRYLEFGMALVEALRVSRDEELQRRLVEMAQWARDPQVRAEAIITLASLSNPAHKKYFREAILDSKVGIRFAAVEALRAWNQPEALDLLRLAKDRDWSPFMQVFAAQALLSLGEKDAIDVLWRSLDHNSWVVRAMAARYLGDFAPAEDYDRLASALNRETRNDFVLAELSIAALKLISKKGDTVSYSPATPGWRQNEVVQYTLGEDDVVELEPLVIVPPRLRIPRSLQIASKINTELLRLVRERLEEPLDPIQAQDPIREELASLVTPTGFALNVRYDQLSYLMVEALGGTNDPLLRSELLTLARDNRNPLVRATALISLAYSRDPTDLYLIQDALNDKSAIVRFGAMEAIDVGRFRDALPSLTSIVNEDPSPALQVFALQLLAKFGDPSGRHQLITRLSDPDWPARAMAYWYLSRYGREEDFTLVVSRLGIEDNPFVLAEITLAALRLAPL